MSRPETDSVCAEALNALKTMRRITDVFMGRLFRIWRYWVASFSGFAFSKSTLYDRCRGLIVLKAMLINVKIERFCDKGNYLCDGEREKNDFRIKNIAQGFSSFVVYAF